MAWLSAKQNMHFIVQFKKHQKISKFKNDFYAMSYYD